jgi:hypothetical protein
MKAITQPVIIPATRETCHIANAGTYLGYNVEGLIAAYKKVQPSLSESQILQIVAILTPQKVENALFQKEE